MAKLGLGRTKSLHLKSAPKDPQSSFVLDPELLENRLVTAGTPNFSRTAKLPDFVTATGHDQDNPIRPQTANAAMDRRKELRAMGSPIVLTSGPDIFNFPTPSRRTSLTQDVYVPEMRSDTPDTIGVALGSPSQAVFFPSPMFESPYQNSLAAPKSITTPPLSTPGRSMTSYESRSTKNELNETVKPKLSRWRSLGGLFGRKSSQARNDRKPSPLAQPPPPARQERRPLPLVQQTSPAPVDLKLHGVHTPEKDIPSRVVYEAKTPPPFAKKTRREKMGMGRTQTAPTGGLRTESPAPPPKGLMLDVEIPDTKMERYSVMFNQTPNLDQTPFQESPPSELLARRQASVNRKRADSSQTLDLPLPPRRRTDTPEPSPGPVLRLFPAERTHSPKPSAQMSHISTVHRPRPLKRSNTAPGALSPDLKEKHSPSPLATMAEVVEDMMDEDIRQASTRTPSEPSTPTTPSDAHTTHSFRTLAANRGSTATTWDPTMTQPSWEMITIGKLAEPGDRFSDAARFAASNVRVRSNSDDKADEDWHHDGEAGVVQIARSISVTKAKRQIVGPRRVDGKRPQVKRIEGQPDVVGPHKVELVRRDGGTERFVERKALTPNLVQMVEMPTGANRKSVRVILEDA
ncbi:hypothetical protein EG328_009588 [Venturia inaequalis]|uniref:Uncharacterized protein n=1 Tax=Venturia inaequalis TaxID=5025 RepID=A0A8H3U9L4_VENIN|nr:hypothetical protein EG328_009588 [Venturia inaequalis]